MGTTHRHYKPSKVHLQISISRGRSYGRLPNDLMANKNVLELGSGPGLGGFVASKWARKVVLTDY